MANFKIAFDITLRNEGGIVYTNDPDDKGGITFAGISRVHNPNWSGWHIIDRLIEQGLLRKTIKDPSCEDYKALYDDVYFLYKHKYWDAIKGDLINNQIVANKFYDAFVNIGYKAIKLMQKAIFNSGDNIICDGLIGRITIDTINASNPDELLELFVDQLKTYYLSLNKPKYIKGWLARAGRIE